MLYKRKRIRLNIIFVRDFNRSRDYCPGCRYFNDEEICKPGDNNRKDIIDICNIEYYRWNNTGRLNYKYYPGCF